MNYCPSMSVLSAWYTTHTFVYNVCIYIPCTQCICLCVRQKIIREKLILLLLLLLSRFSRVRLCATPETAAHQAPPSRRFSRQEHWSGLPFPSPMHESESEVTQVCPTLSDPMDFSLPGSSIHGIFQARILEWVAIAFSRHHV